MFMTDNSPYPTQRENPIMKLLNVPAHTPHPKPPDFESDKFLTSRMDDTTRHSLVAWAELYYRIHVAGAPYKTEIAKKQDLSKFIEFYTREAGTDHADTWTPSVTRRFQTDLMRRLAPTTGQPYKPSTVNRVMATIRHFARWLHKQRPLLAGNPFQGVKDIGEPETPWNGMTDRQLMRLKAAIDIRRNACQRANQNPDMEAAVFYCLLYTGLRESELVALKVSQYHHRAFHQVFRRKGKTVTERVPLPSDARLHLDRYLENRNPQPHEPLFTSRYNNPLNTRDVARLCDRIRRQACAHLPEEERFRLTPHMLRHTFLKRAADKHGIHYAQTMSGNVSIREIFRYTRPSADDIENAAERIFDP
jgi:integrase/recombinase XerD